MTATDDAPFPSYILLYRNPTVSLTYTKLMTEAKIEITMNIHINNSE